MQAFLTSIVIVAVAEIGDRTQLLSMLLAARFRQPLPILAGILCATLANHAAAALIGEWLARWLTAEILRWVLVASFLAMAVWALIPDRLDQEKPLGAGRHGAFAVTLVSFFLTEIGDKTQLATAALAARFDMLLPVIAGTTLGMLLANLPAVYGGHLAGGRLRAGWARYAAAALLAAQAALAAVGYTMI